MKKGPVERIFATKITEWGVGTMSVIHFIKKCLRISLSKPKS